MNVVLFTRNIFTDLLLNLTVILEHGEAQGVSFKILFADF